MGIPGGIHHLDGDLMALLGLKIELFSGAYPQFVANDLEGAGRVVDQSVA